MTRVGPAESSERLDPPDRPARRRPGRRGLAVIAAVLVLAIAAAVAYAVVMAGRVGDEARQERDRADATAVAEQFALRMDNFSSDHLDRYARQINQLLTTKAKAKFDPVFKQFSQVYRQGHVSGSGRVLVAGIGEVDQDSATALVVHDMTARSDGGTQVHHYRWTVSLVKVQGHWRVDDFNQVS